ncbi:MAG TPA: hypothetical protein VFH34_05830 [Anaerolineales bacterium]|nr:hypothetical protein [Anaerolineales bacterium]
MKIKQIIVIALILIIVAGLGNSVAYAASLCVHPTGAGRCFTSIQAAVDAANNGDQILIRPGKYVEQVVISGKDLTLVGRVGAVIQAPAEMQDTLSPVFGFPGRPLLLATDAEVTVRDLTIDGANSAESNPFLQGIVFLNAGGVIRGNIVKDIGFGEPRLPLDENGFPVYQGDGIVVINFLGVHRSVTITENRVLNFNNNGILLDAEADFNDPTIANLTVQVTNNTIVGSGQNGVIDQWGVFIGGFGFADPSSSITGTIRGNRIQNLVTVGDHPLPSVGVVMFNPYNLEVAHNTVENINVGFAANQVVGAQITHNQIVGPGPEVFGSSGVLISGMDSQVVKNRFRKLDTGILLFVEDPQLGSAVNTVMDDNNFDGVTVDIMSSPGAPMALAAKEAKATSLWTKLPHR